MYYKTPLRYPGGKSKLANFIKLLLQQNELFDVHYLEPYAGGAGVALALLFDEYASHIHINDIDRSVYAFWYSVLQHTEELCQLVSDTPVTLEERQRQRRVQERRDTADLLELGFSTFFLNRTNRSGIIHRGGAIGGNMQAGKWKLDARYHKQNLIERIRRVARYRDRIHVHNMDAAVLINDVLPALPDDALAYLDPPYYVKGQELYANFYTHADHAEIARLVSDMRQHWVVSYDNAPAVRALYAPYRSVEYGVRYTAHERYEGAEIMFFSDDLEVPEVEDPTAVDSALTRVSHVPLDLALR